MGLEELYLEKEKENKSLIDIIAIQKETINLLEEKDNYNKVLLSQLKHELDQLKRMIYGSKRERFVESAPDQLVLPFTSEPTQEAEPETEEISYTRKKSRNHPGRNKIPDHIPVQEIIIEPEGDLTGYKKIGEEITETLDYTPGTFFAKRYIRNKYVKIDKEEKSEIVIGSLPERALPKSIAESGLLAWIIVQKLVYHQPFYRQREQFKTLYKLHLSESTINDWFAGVCQLLEPLYNALKQKIISSNYLQVDESPIKVQDTKKKGSTHQGYMWVYQLTEPGYVLFNYRKGRGQNGPKEMLADYEGYLQVDGYGVYDKIAKRSDKIFLVGCAAHARRYFYKAQDNDKERAVIGLNYFKRLYAIERAARENNLTYDERFKLRQEKSSIIFQELKSWAEQERDNVLPKSPIGKAINYLLNHYSKLLTVLKDGKLELDNNLVENSIRPLALGRKNYLFAGSHKGAERLAMMYSFMLSCKRLEVDPYQWLKTVLDKAPSHSVNKVEELLPGNISLGV